MLTFLRYVFSMTEIITSKVIQVVHYGGKSALSKRGMKVENTILVTGVWSFNRVYALWSDRHSSR